jgi:type I restriction enzyme S subunit
MREEVRTSSWVATTVGEITTLIRGITYNKEQAAKSPLPDFKPVLRANNINGTLNFDDLVFVPQSLIGSEQLIKTGDIIFAMSSGSKHLVGKSARARFDFDGSYGAFCGLLRAHEYMDKDFLYYVFQNNKFRRLISEVAKGSNINNLKREHILDFEIALPPLPEQHRIVAKIEELFSELDKGVENLKAAQAQLKVYRQALLKHAFEGKLTAQWREQHRDQLETAAALQQRIQQERAQRYQQQLADRQTNGGSKPKVPKPLPPLTAEELAELPELPEGWVYVRAEEIAGFITKGTTPSKELLFDGSGEIPFIKVYNLTKTGFLDFSIDPTFVSSETHNGFLARSKVYPGDVLMNIVGPPLGKVSIVPNTYSEWNINQAIAIFRSDVISNKFLAAYLAHETTVRSMMKKSKATAGQFNLTLEICRETLIPLCGAEEQNEIELLLEAKLSEVDQLELTLTTSLQQAEALRQSILKKAFSGQLVPQDPHDEPASELLARIKAERATAEESSAVRTISRKAKGK